MRFADTFLSVVAQVVDGLNREAIEQLVELMVGTREQGGRLFILGVGGSAANASHAVCDFRKIADMEAYAPTDNIPELTARTNDEGWDRVFSEWLAGSRLNAKDLVMVFSVGGGNCELNISPNLVRALEYAQEVGAQICGIVGRDGGYTAKVAAVCVLVPTVNTQLVTPLAESFQAMIWHLLVSHPKLQVRQTKWESVN